MTRRLIRPRTLVADWPERHAGAAFVVLLLLFLLGTVGAARIPVDRLALAAPASVQVQVPFPGFDAAVVEQKISVPLERALSSLPGIETIESRSRNGFATVTLRFGREALGSGTLADLHRRLAESLLAVPAGIEAPSVYVEDGRNRPALVYAFTAAEWSDELTRWVRDIFVDPLREVPEVATVVIDGLDRYEIRVEPEPRRLAGLGLGFDDLIAALRRDDRAPRRNPGRRIIVTPGTPEAIAARAVQLASGEPIALGEVARVAQVRRAGIAPPRLGELPALRVSIYPREPQEATRVAERAHAHLAWLRANEVVPPGLGVQVLDDEPAAAKAWAARVIERAAVGIVLILGVVLVALGARTALLVAAAFGVWLAVSVAGLRVLGFALDAATALGIILAFAPFVAVVAFCGRTVWLVGGITLAGALVASLALGGDIGSALVVLLAFALGVAIRWLMAPWLSRRAVVPGSSRRSRFEAPSSRTMATVLLVLAIALAAAGTVSQLGAAELGGRFWFQITGANRTRLEAIAESLVPSLYAIPNARDVVSTVARGETWRLHLDEARMQAAGIEMAEVGRAFAIAAGGLVVGDVVNAERRLPLRLALRPGAAGDSFERLLLRGEHDKRPAVYLRDIGFVERVVEAHERLRVDGRPAAEITARWEGIDARERLRRFCERIEVQDGYMPKCSFVSPVAR